MYLKEIQAALYSRTGTTVDPSTISPFIKKIGMTRKKIKHVPLHQSELKRQNFTREMAVFTPSRLIFIDETGCDLRNKLRQCDYMQYVDLHLGIINFT